MQSMAATRATGRLLPSSAIAHRLRFARASTTAVKHGDPTVHSEDRRGVDANEAAERDAQHHQQKPEHQILINEPTEPMKTPPFASSPKLESTKVGPRVAPAFQQKRHHCHSPPSLDDVSCVGVDGTPLTNKDTYQWQNEEKEPTREYRDYYKDHKPSPLSNIEFADTRKPISRATDGEKSGIWGGESRGYYIRDTVDEALQRAEEMFNKAREEGDLSMPHSQALMRKIRELYQMRDAGEKTGRYS